MPQQLLHRLEFRVVLLEQSGILAQEGAPSDAPFDSKLLREWPDVFTQDRLFTVWLAAVRFFGRWFNETMLPSDETAILHSAWFRSRSRSRSHAKITGVTISTWMSELSIPPRT